MVKFTWEAFNITNTPRFDVGTMQLKGNNSISNSSSFGRNFRPFSFETVEKVLGREHNVP